MVRVVYPDGSWCDMTDDELDVYMTLMKDERYKIIQKREEEDVCESQVGEKTNMEGQGCSE